MIIEVDINDVICVSNSINMPVPSQIDFLGRLYPLSFISKLQIRCFKILKQTQKRTIVSSSHILKEASKSHNFKHIKANFISSMEYLSRKS
jgi:hypothetical protein